MFRSLLVLVAHGLDLLTFVMVIGVMHISGEGNPLMRTLYVSFGLEGVIALKTAGASALAFAVVGTGWPLRAMQKATVPAVGAGILGASVNLLAYSMGGI